MIEGLTWAMPERDFVKRFGQFKSEKKFPCCHPGIVAIKFCYREEYVPELDQRETKSDGRVFVTFASETLGYLFVLEFHGHTGMDLEQYWGESVH